MVPASHQASLLVPEACCLGKAERKREWGWGWAGEGRKEEKQTLWVGPDRSLCRVILRSFSHRQAACLLERPIWHGFENGNNYKLMMDMEKSPAELTHKEVQTRTAGKLQAENLSSLGLLVFLITDFKCCNKHCCILLTNSHDRQIFFVLFYFYHLLFGMLWGQCLPGSCQCVLSVSAPKEVRKRVTHTHSS